MGFSLLTAPKTRISEPSKLVVIETLFWLRPRTTVSAAAELQKKKRTISQRINAPQLHQQKRFLRALSKDQRPVCHKPKVQ